VWQSQKLLQRLERVHGTFNHIACFGQPLDGMGKVTICVEMSVSKGMANHNIDSQKIAFKYL
jgi:hypothetical protein